MRSLGTTALVVGGGGLGTGLVRSMALPFPVLVDRDRVAYRAYGLTRAMHVLQESGTFLIDRAGVVRHAVHSHNPSGALEWGPLLAAVRELADRDGGHAVGSPA